MPRAISPGPAGLKFWRSPGLSADNTADIKNLPAGIANQFNPWGPRRPVQDWVRGCSPALISVIPAGEDTANLPAGIANQFNPWGRKQPVRDWVWFNSALYAPAVPVTFTAAADSYTLTGSAAAQALGHTAGTGSYALTGSAAALALRQTIGAGSYALTGSAAALALGQVTGAGSYNATGSAAVLALRHVAGAGSYALTGSAAGLVIPGGLTASAGSYALTGSAAGLVIPGGLTASAGSYTLTGSAATIGAGAIDYVPGWTEWFNPWGPRRGREYWIWSVAYQAAAAGGVTLSAGTGIYTLGGSAAGLATTSFQYVLRSPLITRLWQRPPRQDWIWSVAYTTAPGGVTLSAGTGIYTLGGSAAGLAATSFQYVLRSPLITRLWQRPPRQDWIWSVAYQAAAAGTTFTAAAGSYTLTGAAASFPVRNYVLRPPLIFRNWSRSRQVAVSAQNWVKRNQFIGYDVRLPADAGSYVLTGSTAGLAFGLTANSGSYTLTGFAAVLARALPAAAGSYALTGTDADLIQAGTIVLPAAAGSYAITGTDAAFAVPPADIVISGGRRFYTRPARLPVEGEGYAVLPQFVGEAHGVVIAVSGGGAVVLDDHTGEATGSVGVAGHGVALINLRVMAVGAVGTRGVGEGSIFMKFNGTAFGRHDDNAAAVITFLLAA